MSAVTLRARGEEREFPFSAEEFQYLASIVYDLSGIVLKDHKKNMVYSRLARRLRELKLTSFRDYCDLLKSKASGDEIGFLINAITTNLTKFLREPHHFDHMVGTALPELSQEAARSGSRRLRVWSAGCSSGEEPYSIAMSLAEGFRGLASWDARILATDLDTSMVARATAGVYPAAAFTELPGNSHDRYFRSTRNSDERSASDSLRKLITFKKLNLLRQWPMKGPFDIIFCRNVMIYFDTETKTRLVQRFADLLKPGGWLYIGHSESLLDDQSAFTLSGRTIYRKTEP